MNLTLKELGKRESGGQLYHPEIRITVELEGYHRQSSYLKTISKLPLGCFLQNQG
jgi:hypothetical protein